MKPAVVTIVTRNYIPLARVLMESAARSFPESQRYVLLLDGPDETIADAQILRMSDILSPEEELIQQYIYMPYQLATGLKPKFLMHMLQSVDQVFFLDPDMRLFQPMTAAVEALSTGAGTLFTPHRLTPPALDNRDVYEWAFKMYGTYNAGFVGVTRASLPFLEWWDSRLRRDCIQDAEGGHWLDQKIADLAPAYFDIDLLKDPAYNVGWWNLEERPIHREGETWYAGSAPLVLMHFSSVRPNLPAPALPYLVYTPASKVASDLVAVASLRDLEQAYIASLYAAGYAELGAEPFAYNTTPGGRPFSRDDREHYRELVLAAEARGETPPHPDDFGLPSLTRRAKNLAREFEFPRALWHDGRRLFRRGRDAVKSGLRRG